MTETNGNKVIWTFIGRQIVLVGVIISCCLAVWSQMASLDKQVALNNQKLDRLIVWTEQHDSSHQLMRQQLNLTFADIFEKLGSKYINQ